MLEAGKYRFRADVEVYIKTGVGGRGQPVGEWNPIYTAVPCRILPLNGKELELTRQLVAKATHKVEMRWISGVTAEMRLNFIGRLFNIGYVDETDFKLHKLVLTVMEQTTGASPA